MYVGFLKDWSLKHKPTQVEIDEQTGEEVEKENLNYAAYKFHTEPIIETKDYRTSYQ